MKYKSLYLLSFLIFALATGCKKVDATEPTDESTGTTGGIDVYATGSNAWNSFGYWKNGAFVSLTTMHTVFDDIVVNGKDVYVCGAVSGNIGCACYWKNGALTVLHDGKQYTEAMGIAFLGKDIYIAGYILTDPRGVGRTACYWKNGTRTILPGKGEYTDARGIAVKGNDIYICGSYTSAGRNFSCYWKNGELFTLAGEVNHSAAIRIAIYGDDIYITGFINATGRESHNVSAYWKNGILQTLPQAVATSVASDIAIGDNGDVHIVEDNSDYTLARGLYWKNGIKTTEEIKAQSSSIAVSGTDVYVGGSLWIVDDPNNKKRIPAYWKNGEIVKLNESVSSNVGAMAVVTRN
ncbi:MAG: hypothetical protein V4619_10680 [Bacteroidota bacterium]